MRRKEGMSHHIAKLILLSTVALIVAGTEKAHADPDDPCRLGEARQIACAAARKSYEIDHSWTRAQGVFGACMSYLNCSEPRKWDGVCR